MLHLGDITKINGGIAPVVDCIIFGAPCQDLSVAGKRAGMKHGDLGDEEATRSGLFMEAVRIIKEMRKRDEYNGRTGIDIRPRYGIYENVPGAFSSNKGEDFRIVLEELAKVKDPNAVIPMPEKWATSGCIVGDGWSIAWRVLDAQFWGVPQRRRRIALVADFGGQSAPEILFVTESVSGHTESGEQKGKRTSIDAERSLGADDRLGADQYNAVVLGDTVSTLGVNCGMSHGRQCVLEPCGVDFFNQALTGEVSKTLNSVATDSDHVPSVVYSVENHPNDSRVGINEDGKVQAPTQRMGTGGGNVPMVMLQCYSKSKRAQSATDNETWVESDTANTLNAFDVGDVRTTEAVVYQDTVGSLCARDYKGVGSQYVDEGKLIVAKGPSAVCYWDGAQVTGTLTANNAGGSQRMPDKDNFNCVIQKNARYIVRRLTPLECERLQGYPDGWTDIGEWTDSNGKKRQTSDAARYKALGNSIALPPWKWVLKRLCACYERDAMMASLFSGIGGFDLLWTQLNGMGSVLWESEIDDYPSAVCRRHFGDEDTGEKGDFYEAILGRNKTENV